MNEGERDTAGAAFLGSGWRFPLKLGDDGVTLLGGQDLVRQSIWLILGTAPGERVMRPDFGCGIHELVYSVANANIRGRIADRVREALLRWEPRIDVLDVVIRDRRDRPEILDIDVTYRVRTTNNVFNLVYPFHLHYSGEEG